MKKPKTYYSNDLTMHTRFLIILSAIWLIINVWLIVFLIANQAPRMEIFSIGARVGLLILAFIIDFTRTHRNFYLPGLKEISRMSYWIAVNGLLAFHSAIHFYFQANENTIIKGLQAGTVAGYFLVTLYFYQQKPWARYEQARRKNTIAQFTKKARLSEVELESIKPHLIKGARERQRSPLYWRIIWWLMALLLASVFSNYASEIINIFTVALPFSASQ